MSALREARLARGWSQTRLRYELMRRAEAQGMALPDLRTMKTQLSRWENGHRRPDDFYRSLFRSVYGLTDEQLGFSYSGPAGAAGSMVEGLLSGFAEILAGYTAMDHLGGHQPLLVAVGDHARYLEALAHKASGADRAEILRLTGRYAEFAGWLHQDSGDISRATFWTDRAMDCAQQLGNPRTISYVLHRKSNIATDDKSPAFAVGLAEAALRDRNRLSPRLQAVALRQHANASALSGDREGCLRSLDLARAAATAPVTDPDDEIAGYCSPAYVEMEAGHCWTQLGEPGRAVAVLRRALATWPAGQERDRGLCLARLALAHAQSGDLDAAASAGIDALAVVQSSASARSLDQLRRLRVLLAGSRNVGSANQFEAALSDLLCETGR
jgi:transcriptional regulator with XRE-family HTH domain